VRQPPPNRHDLRTTRASRRINISGMAHESAIRPHIEGQLHTRFLDREMARLARGQHGVVARRQLLHRSAAQLWRLLPQRAEPIHVTAPGRQVRREGIEAHRCRLRDDEWLIRDGIPATSPFRTIFDLAAVVEMRELERAFHETEARELTDRVSLPLLLERYPGRRGSKSLRTLLEARTPVGITRNDFEEAFVALVDRFGLPRPRMNADLAIRGRFFEIDALWEPERVAVELDSRSIHGTHEKFESDRLRDRILIAEGWRTMRFTWRQLQDEPHEISDDLKKALGQAITHTHPASRCGRWP
jgi:very-short-patch-repair endonuclease